jgi:L-ascorbate metabolism protein UlaG (beta-lactamase superfamily)
MVSTFAVALLAAGMLCNGAVSAQSQAQPQAQAQGKIEVLWLGQSATRIRTVAGKVIVIDPWLTGNPKTPQEYKNLDVIGKMDIILVTHAHGDHIGDARALSKKYNVPMWGPADLNQTLQTLGVMPAESRHAWGKAARSSPSRT